MKRSVPKNLFELEPLEQRILLSGDSLLLAIPTGMPDESEDPFATDLALLPSEEVPLSEDDSVQETPSLYSDPYNPADAIDDLFAGLTEEGLFDEGAEEDTPEETYDPNHPTDTLTIQGSDTTGTQILVIGSAPEAQFAGTDSLTHVANNGQENSYGATVTTEVESGIEFTMDLPAGWSMISLPLVPDSTSVSALFPEAVVAYGYEKGAGYVRKQTLEVGKGYWILLNEAQSYTLTGRPIQEYALSVNQDGWDMIGGCTEPAKASVDTDNIGVIYKFTQGFGYQRVSGNLAPSQGYWVLLKDVVGTDIAVTSTNLDAFTPFVDLRLSDIQVKLESLRDKFLNNLVEVTDFTDIPLAAADIIADGLATAFELDFNDLVDALDNVSLYDLVHSGVVTLEELVDAGRVTFNDLVFDFAADDLEVDLSGALLDDVFVMGSVDAEDLLESDILEQGALDPYITQNARDEYEVATTDLIDDSLTPVGDLVDYGLLTVSDFDLATVTVSENDLLSWGLVTQNKLDNNNLVQNGRPDFVNNDEDTTPNLILNNPWQDIRLTPSNDASPLSLTNERYDTGDYMAGTMTMALEPLSDVTFYLSDAIDVGATQVDEAIPAGCVFTMTATFAVEMNLPAGWSMISLPVIPDSTSVAALFPDAVVVYGYEKGSGYVRKQTLEVGKGYWILLNEAQSYTLTGQPIQEYALSVNQDGWDMIGGYPYSAQVLVDHGKTAETYEYFPGIGYQPVLESENLELGKGYWVRLSPSRQAIR